MGKPYFITSPDAERGDGLYLFRRRFHAEAGMRFTARVSADTRYKLYLNGCPVSIGPCKGTDFTHYYETVDLSEHLVDGENELFAAVLHLDDLPEKWPVRLTAVTRGAYAAFMFDGRLERGEVTREIVSDAEWQACRDESVAFDLPVYSIFASLNQRITPCENKFSSAVPLYMSNLDTLSSNPWGELDCYVLKPRPIPPLAIGEKTVLCVSITVPPHSKRSITLDAGTLVTSYVFADFKGGAGSSVKITYSECYEFEENGRYVKRQRDDDKGTLRGDYDLIAPGGDYIFESFWFKTFRFIKLDIETADEPLMCAEIYHRETCYPLEIRASFSCSEPVYNKMWEVSLRTLKCCMRETFEDCPYHEQLQYAMDTRLQMLFAYQLSNDYALQKKALLDFAESRLPSGLLQARYPSTRKQIIPGFSLHFIYMLEDYLIYTGDLATVKDLMHITDGILNWFDGRLNEDGFVGATGYWPFVDWADNWNEGVPLGKPEEPLTVYSMMYAAALQSAARIAIKYGRVGVAVEYRNRADAVCEGVKKHCYNSGRRMFQDIPGRENYSEQGQVWAILCGLGEYTDIEKALTDESVTKCSFVMRFFTLRALEATDKYELCTGLYEVWTKFLDLNCTTWPETPENPRSECHAWSASPIYEFAHMILGVKPAEGGVLIQPYTGKLEYASGIVATRYGDIAVSWNKIGDVTSATVSYRGVVQFSGTISKDCGVFLKLFPHTQKSSKTLKTRTDSSIGDTLRLKSLDVIE